MLVDAGFLIGLFRKNDFHHERAQELYSQLEESGETLVLTEAVLAEFVTHISRRHDPATASFAGKKLLETKGVELVFPSEYDVKEALAYMSKFELDSYADALSVQTMVARKIRKVVSFDADFDRVPGIKRIH